MEELFFENFSTQKQNVQPIIRKFGEKEVEGFLVESFYKEEKNSQLLTNTLDSSLSQAENQNFFSKNHDLIPEMVIFLNRLEKEVEKKYLDFADYRFIFNKIRSELKKKSVKGVLDLLNDLEELLDVGLSSMMGN